MSCLSNQLVRLRKRWSIYCRMNNLMRTASCRPSTHRKAHSIFGKFSNKTLANLFHKSHQTFCRQIFWKFSVAFADDPEKLSKVVRKPGGSLFNVTSEKCSWQTCRKIFLHVSLANNYNCLLNLSNRAVRGFTSP